MLRDGAGKILDRMIDIALAAVDLAAQEKGVRNIRTDGKRGVEIGERGVELRGLQIGPRPARKGRRQILPQLDRLVEVGNRLGPGFLVVFQIAAREKSKGILRLELDGAVHIGTRGIKAAAAAAQIAALDQRRNELRVQLKRGFGIVERKVEFRPADVETPAIDIGLGAIVRRTRGIIDHCGAGGLDLVGCGSVAVFQVAGASRVRRQQDDGDQDQRRCANPCRCVETA